MTYRDYEHRRDFMIKKYNARTGANAVGTFINGNFYSSFPPFDFSMLSFSFQLNLAISVDIDINVIFDPAGKAKYGSAVYGISVYDPVTVLGVLTADSITKWLMAHMARRFLLRNERGYKYSLPESFYWLNAEIPMLEIAGQEPVWYVRSRKIDATRNWTAFYDMSFFDVNAFPTAELYGGYDLCEYDDTFYSEDDLTESEILIRISDMLLCIFDLATFDLGEFDKPTFGLDSLDNIFYSSVRVNNISANFFDTAIFDRAPFSGVTMPYRELYILVPNLVAYEPIFDVANFDYDVFYSTVTFDEDLVNTVIENAKLNQAVQYRELIQFTQSERMHSNYATMANFQVMRQYRIQTILRQYLVKPVDLHMYHAFAMQFGFKHMVNQLMDKETIIQRYIRLGLNETVLRAIAALPSR